MVLLNLTLLGLVQPGYKPEKEQISKDNANSGINIRTLGGEKILSLF